MQLASDAHTHEDIRVACVGILACVAQLLHSARDLVDIGKAIAQAAASDPSMWFVLMLLGSGVCCLLTTMPLASCCVAHMCVVLCALFLFFRACAHVFSACIVLEQGSRGGCEWRV